MITIIIPCYNEAQTIGFAISEIDFLFSGVQIIVVDNNSTDNSPCIIQNYWSCKNIYEHYQCSEQGKASAINSVVNHIKFATVILHDADLEYRGFEIKNLAELHVKENADMTIGVRKNKLFTSMLANTFIRFVLKLKMKATTSDVLTGARVVNKSLLKSFGSKQFGIETELTKIVLKNKLKLVEGECYYNPRTVGKKIKLWHMFEMVAQAICE
ncbi:MAG: glycosyltransferase family 2 protein [Burkholderiales bacterium]|nr:glycosyltransferase family 2 protein [Burkholderiales bacterium]